MTGVGVPAVRVTAWCLIALERGLVDVVPCEGRRRRAESLLIVGKSGYIIAVTIGKKTNFYWMDTDPVALAAAVDDLVGMRGMRGMRGRSEAQEAGVERVGHGVCRDGPAGIWSG